MRLDGRLRIGHDSAVLRTVRRCVYPGCEWGYEEPEVRTVVSDWSSSGEPASSSPLDVMSHAITTAISTAMNRQGAETDAVILAHLEAAHPGWTVEHLKELSQAASSATVRSPKDVIEEALDNRIRSEGLTTCLAGDLDHEASAEAVLEALQVAGWSFVRDDDGD